jgi:hypothetical protein
MENILREGKDMDEEYYTEDWQDDESDLRNHCPCCGHNYITDGNHDDEACDRGQE